MTFRQFEAFAAVARHKNITKAARELHTSQPSISKHLKTLEYDYRTRLFKRSGKGVELTGDGAEFLNYIEPILGQLKSIEDRFVKNPAKYSATPLMVGGTFILSATILPVVVKAFHESCPTVRVVLRTSSTVILEELVVKGTLEIALISAPARRSEVVAERCIPLKLVAFAAKGYRLPSHRDRDLRKGEELPLIIRGGGTQNGHSDAVLKELRDRGYKPKIVLECESPESLKMAVKQRLGIGILYDEIVRKDIASGVFKRLPLPGVSRQTTSYFVHHRERSLSENAQAFLTLLRNWCAASENKFGRAAARPPR